MVWHTLARRSFLPQIVATLPGVVSRRPTLETAALGSAVRASKSGPSPAANGRRERLALQAATLLLPPCWGCQCSVKSSLFPVARGCV